MVVMVVPVDLVYHPLVEMVGMVEMVEMEVTVDIA